MITAQARSRRIPRRAYAARHIHDRLTSTTLTAGGSSTVLFTYGYDSTHYACDSYHYLQVPMTAPGPTLHDTAAYGAAQKVRGNVTDKALPRGQICGLVNSR